MVVYELLREESIRVNMKANSKEEAIAELVDLLAAGRGKLDGKELIKSASERESRISTGLGKGVAVPRCRTDGIRQVFCSIGMKPEGIDFEALDGLPVRIFFMVAAPKKSDDVYVRILCRLYRLLNQETFRSDLLKIRSPKEVLSLIKEEEKGFED